jgi:hypothetical protein
MARHENADCKRCSAQSAQLARQRPCWNHQNPQTCHSARSYYKRQEVNKAKKRSQHRGDRIDSLKGDQGEDMVILPLRYSEPPEVQILFFQDRADGRKHALQFTVLDGGQKIDGVKAIHLKGMGQKALRSHIKNVLGILAAKHHTEFAVSTARQATKFCPLCFKQRIESEHDD